MKVGFVVVAFFLYGVAASSWEPTGSTGWSEPSPTTGSAGWSEPSTTTGSTGWSEPSTPTGTWEPTTGSTGWTEPSTPTGTWEPTTGSTGWTEPSTPTGTWEPTTGSTGWTEPSTPTGTWEPTTGSTGWTEPSTPTGTWEPTTGSTGWAEPSTPTGTWEPTTGSTGWTEPSTPTGTWEPTTGSTGWTEPSTPTGTWEPTTGSTGWTEPSTPTGTWEPTTGSTGWTEPTTESTETTTATTENPAEVKKEIELLKRKIVEELFEIRQNFSQEAEVIRFSVNYYKQQLVKAGEKAWKKIQKSVESQCKKSQKDIKKLMDKSKDVDIRECLKGLTSSACNGEPDVVVDSRQCVSQIVSISSELSTEINDLIDVVYRNISDSREQMGSCLANGNDGEKLECLRMVDREVRALKIADVPETIAQIKVKGWVVVGLSIQECKMEDQLAGLLIDLQVEVLSFEICTLLAAKPNPSTPNPTGSTPTWEPSISTSEGSTWNPWSKMV